MEEFNPFKFDGRIGRLQYLGYGLLWGVIIFVVALSAGASHGAYGVYLGLMIVYFIATVSYGVRRLHDFGQSGWWYLLAFVPYANFVLGIVLLVVPGTPGENEHGVRGR